MKLSHLRGKCYHLIRHVDHMTPLKIPYIGIFSCGVFLAKITMRRCVILSPSLIFAIWWVLNGDVLLRLFFTECNFSDIKEVTNSAKIKPSRKFSDIWYWFTLTQGHIFKTSPANCLEVISITWLKFLDCRQTRMLSPWLHYNTP